MKLSFITSPVTETSCKVTLVKAIKQHDPVSVHFYWAKKTVRGRAAWSPEGFALATEEHAYIKSGANLLHSVDRFFLENNLYGCGPEELMKKLEDAKMEQVVVVGTEQVSVDEIEKVKDQYAPAGFEGLQVGAVDLEDATSTIKGRMLKILKDDESKAEAVGRWFAEGKKVEKVGDASRPSFTHQSEYHL